MGAEGVRVYGEIEPQYLEMANEAYAVGVDAVTSLDMRDWADGEADPVDPQKLGLWWGGKLKIPLFILADEEKMRSVTPYITPEDGNSIMMIHPGYGRYLYATQVYGIAQSVYVERHGAAQGLEVHINRQTNRLHPNSWPFIFARARVLTPGGVIADEGSTHDISYGIIPLGMVSERDIKTAAILVTKN